MAHDYAKKPRAKTKTVPKAKRTRRAPEPPVKSIPGWMWLVVGLAMGAFVMFLVRLADVDTVEPVSEPAPKAAPQVHTTTRVAPAKTAAKPQAQAQPAKAEPQKPRFDFYHMLKENEVPVAAPRGGETQAKPKPERIFILQVASFKKAEDAEQLRVELLLLNLDARTEEVKVRNGEIWHRVLTGPFKSRSQLAKARSTLISNGHQALVMEFKAPKK